MKPESILLSVLENGGCMSEEEAAQLATVFPEMRVCAKMSCSPRFCVPMRELVSTLTARTIICPDDYAREVYIPANVWDILCASLGVKKPY